mmetsp:Transcript_12139/g.16669  ORF Transcript_12139/g.16669 Transcript_12139/m.16669 type:complete len:475 (-) Transcript_12139:805-2229(-)
MASSYSPECDPLLKEGIEFFRSKFDCDPTLCAFAPGRVNLIGEHTDYNDGFVLPFALPYRTYLIGSRAVNTTETKIHSKSQEPSVATFEINSNLSMGEPQWADYIKGTIFQYLPEIEAGFAFNAVAVTSVPLGGGLSSSAALEVATATFLEGLLGEKASSVSKVTKALRCQKAEHDFANTPCGIMDQYISAMGSKGNLLLIDCRTNTFESIPFGISASSPMILITNSMVKHKLSGSEYPDRVKQCKEAVKAAQSNFPSVKALRDVTEEMFKTFNDELSDIVYRRAKHAIGEDQRTLAAVTALKAGDYQRVGELMTQSHNSLQVDYEVSCDELDLLVKLALAVPGVYGSRMTGGGFGGCTVTLVDREAIELLEQTLYENYFKQTSKKCVFYRTEPAEGAGFFEFDILSEDMKAPPPPLKPITSPIVTDVPSETYRIPGADSRAPSSSTRPAWIDWVVPVSVMVLVGAVTYLKLRK